ncbi:precorrin-4 C(11)-methyltransferase [Nakamurella antarctica]|uniref:Precorrin-4 C(11)-methyltransferase n=1 Tax=Nakamurella antarctica TaxID=1902245 RepID=A0A3G8ZPF9_9ACTN|nr:SAM-dependent methyltransferase [Nakamurella antarctica]AZI59018.1 precorrin-4 C(11)-methyltransferase [Nakamurella antarctica]
MTVHFVGAGPGAADLLTLRAASILGASPVCLYAGTYIGAAVLQHCPVGAQLIDTQHLDLDAIISHLVEADRAGHDVARLCSGDPSLYSALAEQTRRLDDAGVPWDVTPGVPAYAAAAAILGRELTVPELAQTVILTRAQARSTAMPTSERLSEVAKIGGTLALHLAITRTRAVMAELLPEYGPDCPVAVVADASTDREIVLQGTVSSIADQVEAAGLKQAAVILVGPALARPGSAESHLYSKRPRSGSPG